MANKQNLAAGIIGADVGTSSTTIPLRAGYGQTMPAVPFFATATPPGQLSTMGNSEIVEVTARNLDDLTVTRAQKGTTAKDIQDGWSFVNGIYTDDVEGGGVAIQDEPPENTSLLWIDTDEPAPNNVITEVLQAVYPVGSLYMNRTDSTNPADKFGFGTWVAVENKMIMGVGASFPADGGSETHSHSLSDNGYAQVSLVDGSGYTRQISASSWNANAKVNGSAAVTSFTNTVGAALDGSTDTSSTIPPMIVAHIWERTA